MIITLERSDVQIVDDEQIVSSHYCLDESHLNFWRYFIKLSYLRVGFGVTGVHVFLKLQMCKDVKWLTKPKLH